MIGTARPELSFVDFIVNLAPVAIFTLAVVTSGLAIVYRRRLRVDPERAREVAKLDAARDLRDAKNVKRTLAVLLGTIAAFFLHTLLHLEPAVVALTGATVMLLVAADDVESALERIEWSTLFFFLGLFVMVGGLQERGVVDQVAEWLADVSGGSPRAEGMIVLWGAAAGSAVVDNIPFTAAMIPVVESLQGGQFDDGLWWALALGACFGGNATLVAAAANVAAAGVLERAHQPISFMRFLAVGVPVTFVSLLIATAYLLVFQL
jgi:Na+/H+ antiporter NhaD/arsenite permease-like protein